MSVFDVDWERTFLPGTPFLEIFLRGTVVYLVLFGLLRAVLRRESGAVGITDLLVVVLLADAAQNAMADDYTSIPDGVLLVATIVFWSHALNWLGFRYPLIQRLVHPAPLKLIEDGRLLRRNMRRELVTEDEILSQVRLQGMNDLSQVEEAFIEGDGRISVVARNGKTNGNAERLLL